MFMSIPNDMIENDIEMHYTFTSQDIDFINKHRRDYNRLGISVQLAVLRYPGWTLFQLRMYLNRRYVRKSKYKKPNFSVL